MRQSKNKKREVTAAIYVRLSRDDNLEGESYSIGNQKKLLTKIAKEKGYTNLLTFCDDGISGVTMERDGYKDMIKAILDNKVSAVFVKDLSRLGRNYIEVGKLTEEFLPDHDIRLVAVSDNIDTEEGENELAQIKNLFNEWYARDISKKRRISNKIKGNAGEPMGLPPYGYMKNPDGSKSWVVDEEAAAVVRRIFNMTLDGMGTQYESEFAKIVMGHSIQTAQQERQKKQKELNSLTARDKELDNLFEHIYEDNVSGKISDDRFAKLSAKYEAEQKEITARMKELQEELDKDKSKAVTSDMFMASVRKYTRARKLTPRMLNELIEKIEVHQSEKIDGKTVQRLTIHYNCIGAIEIPDLDKLPENKVSVHTRQGVDVHYAACAS